MRSTFNNTGKIMMRIAEINVAEISTVLSLAQSSAVAEPVVVLFVPTWKRRMATFKHTLEHALHIIHHDLFKRKSIMCKGGGDDPHVYLVTVGGSDEFAESYVVDHLGLTSLPAMAIFASHVNRNVAYDGNVDKPIYCDSLFTMLSNSEHMLALVGATISGLQLQLVTKEISPKPLDAISALFKTNSLYPVSSDSLVLFVAGDKSSVGKSSVCLGILTYLVNSMGVLPEQLAYIKPVTQCETEQLVSQFCRRTGIAYSGVGPVVFYKGFTRAYLQGHTETSEELLTQVARAVSTIGRDKVLTIIDGVGYPSVGSICGISNADVARTVGAPVLLVGKAGVGDAVDSYNLNAAFFESKGVTVLGGIFNKLPLTGFYSLEACQEALVMYFTHHRPGHSLYGLLPMIEVNSLVEGSAMDVDVDDASASLSTFHIKMQNNIQSQFDIHKLLVDLWRHKLSQRAIDPLELIGPLENLPTEIVLQTVDRATSLPSFVLPRAGDVTPFAPNSSFDLRKQRVTVAAADYASGRKRSREDIEQTAKSKGARGG